MGRAAFPVHFAAYFDRELLLIEEGFSRLFALEFEESLRFPLFASSEANG